MIIRWDEASSMAVYGLDETGDPHLILDSYDMSIHKNNRIIDYMGDGKRDYYDYYGTDDSFTIYSISGDGYTLKKEDHYSMKGADNDAGCVCFHNKNEITEDEYYEVNDKLLEEPEIDLKWTKLMTKSNEWK